MDAVVAFHPAPIAAPLLRRLSAPVLIHHGMADRQVAFENSVALERSLASQGTFVQFERYRQADHGFLAYTRPAYRAEDAVWAWRRTIEFLRAYVVTARS